MDQHTQKQQYVLQIFSKMNSMNIPVPFLKVSWDSSTQEADGHSFLNKFIENKYITKKRIKLYLIYIRNTIATVK